MQVQVQVPQVLPGNNRVAHQHQVCTTHTGTTTCVYTPHRYLQEASSTGAVVDCGSYIILLDLKKSLDLNLTYLFLSVHILNLKLMCSKLSQVSSFLGSLPCPLSQDHADYR